MVSNDDLQFIRQNVSEMEMTYPPFAIDGGYLYLTVPSGERWDIAVISVVSELATILSYWIDPPGSSMNVQLYQSPANEKWNPEPILPKNIVLNEGWKIGAHFGAIGSSYTYYLQLILQKFK